MNRISLLICLVPFLAVDLSGQDFNTLQISSSPLSLKTQGSFYIGGDVVQQSTNQLGSFSPAGHITVNQMYVRYMIPVNEKRVSVVMIHGMALTGKCWETTPDGRMGWDEYFVRQGYPVYVPDQVGRGRSGFNQAVYNDVRTGTGAATSLPSMWRFSDENVWPNFRIGPKPGEPFPEAKFPVEAMAELSKQGVPDVSMTLPSPNPNHKGLSELSIRLKRCVLISHSQSGSFPMEAALISSSGLAGLVIIEPGRIRTDYTVDQIKALTKFPILVVFGDYLEIPTGISGHSWKTAFDNSNIFIKQINDAGGNAKMLSLPGKGISGNSHMIMHDKNNLQVADMIMRWIDENVEKRN